MVDFHDIWWKVDVIPVDVDAIIFNRISLNILKWLRFKVVRRRHDFQPCAANGLGLFECWNISVHHLQSLANVTIENIACNLL
jgi:hypothetical protein